MFRIVFEIYNFLCSCGGLCYFVAISSCICNSSKPTDDSSCFIDLDKSGYQVHGFLISQQKYMFQQKHMSWVLIRSASPRRF